MARIWNQVVEEGAAFPQKENLTDNDAKDFFEAQTVSAVAVNELGEVKGLFILHPNNVGRVGHICNASFAVDENCRGEHIGKKGILLLVADGADIGQIVGGHLHALAQALHAGGSDVQCRVHVLPPGADYL